MEQSRRTTPAPAPRRRPIDHISYTPNANAGVITLDRQASSSTPIIDKSSTLRAPSPAIVVGVTPETQRQLRTSGRTITVPSFTIAEEFAPALRSAIEDITNRVGTALESPSSYSRETALTYAAIGLGALRAAVCRVVPTSDVDYEKR